MALNGIEKASLLLMALGTSASAQVFKHLSEDEIEKLSAEIVRMREVDPSLMQAVVQEFERVSTVRDAAIPEVDLTQGSRPNQRPFEALSRTEAGRIAQLLLEEQPQVIALVLASLPRNKAAAALAEFDEDTQSRIALCICQMEEVDPEVIAAIEQSLQTKLATTIHKTSQRTGAQTLIEILNNASHDTGRAVLGALQKTAPTFAEQVRGRMFTFEDLPRLDDTAIVYVLREVDNDDLVIALKASDDHIRELVLRNMSLHAAEALKESLEIPMPVKVRDIEASQQRIAGVARHLLAMGIIAMSDTEEERVA
jgi:flagellar motor switch protein FliG